MIIAGDEIINGKLVKNTLSGELLLEGLLFVKSII